MSFRPYRCLHDVRRRDARIDVRKATEIIERITACLTSPHGPRMTLGASRLVRCGNFRTLGAEFIR
jgi:hypothetical protein